MLNGIMQPISHGEYEQYKKEIQGDLVKTLELIVFIHEKRILKVYRGEYFSIDNLKKEIEKGI